MKLFDTSANNIKTKAAKTKSVSVFLQSSTLDVSGLTASKITVPKILLLKTTVSILSIMVVSSMASCTSSQPTKPVKIVHQDSPSSVQKSKYEQLTSKNSVIIESEVKQPINNHVIKNTQNYANFSEWKTDFTSRAAVKGYDFSSVQRLLDNAHYNSRVVSLDGNQAEFVKMPWEYVENAVAGGKITTGRQKFTNNPNTFGQISSNYSVSPYIVAAIWGMESSYGGFTGSSNLASSLATLAYDGRRREFAENQLLALVTLINRGDVSWYQMDGSWAGGMGHTQFIPATWLAQGVDGNGDGQKNPWNADDALSSTANYLTRSGWVRGLDPYYEVTLPNGFDYTQTNTTKTVSEWMNRGIQMMNSGGYGIARLGNNTPVKLWLPAGQDGPALLLTQNFDVIKVYNNSSNYALGVSLLAKRIAGESGLQKAWPKYERPLSKYQARQLQQRLTDLGYDTNGVDGVIGTNTRKAFQRWQADNGEVADGFISQRTTNRLVY